MPSFYAYTTATLQYGNNPLPIYYGRKNMAFYVLLIIDTIQI